MHHHPRSHSVQPQIPVTFHPAGGYTAHLLCGCRSVHKVLLPAFFPVLYKRPASIPRLRIGQALSGLHPPYSPDVSPCRKLILHAPSDIPGVSNP